ncbi:MAG: hypothetical protein QUV05_21680 [Phycisphaerae bacterium]|nr:hypothetical protein [Phycisphaerae bacterium]
MKGDTRRQVLIVANRGNGEILYCELLREWFEQLLIDHTLFEAGVAGLGEMRVRPRVEAAEDATGMIVGWRVTLFTDDDRIIFRRRWPVSVLEPTARAVAAQCRPLMERNQVIYWATRYDMERSGGSSGDGIEFDEADAAGDGLAITPLLPVLEPPATGTMVCDCFPIDLVLVLSPDAFGQLIRPIRDGISAECEIAWAAGLRLARSKEDQTLIYQASSLKRIVSRGATAGRVPLEAADLLAAVCLEEPVLLLHTHTVPSESKDRGALLACSWDDLRCMYRLRAGSLFGIVSGRLPLELRIYGFENGRVREMNAKVLVTSGMEGGTDGTEV